MAENISIPTSPSKRKLQMLGHEEEEESHERSMRRRRRRSLPMIRLFDNDDILERILSRLPPSTFLRLASLSARFSSFSSSPTFRLACSEVPSRAPWFLMVDHDHDNHDKLKHSSSSLVVFDSYDRCWNRLPRLQLPPSSIPVASSAGLVCFRSSCHGDFAVCNPLSGSARLIPCPDHLPRPDNSLTLHAIVMRSSPSPEPSFELILVHGEFPNIFFNIFDSKLGTWGPDVALSRSLPECDSLSNDDDFSDNQPVYFLSKTGKLVTTDMFRSPTKQYSSVLIPKDTGGGKTVYFLSSRGTVVACDLTRMTFSEYPRLLPFCSEYSIDIMECRGQMAVAVLSEFLETASLRIWRFDEESRLWAQMAAMPPSMSHEFYDKNMDINCTGSNGQILICLNSGEDFRYITYDAATDEWVETPECPAKSSEFSSAFSFEPRIEASV